MTASVQTPSVKELPELVVALMQRIDVLEKTIDELKSGKKSSASTRDMTDDDARKILFGDLKDKSHKDSAAELGLSYGQVYSCRGEFTFKAIHKEMKDKGIANRWVK